MGLDIYWLEFAENKLDDIFNYSRKKTGAKTALNLVQGIIETTIALRNQPENGQVEGFLKHRTENLRYLVYRNYKIIYWKNHENNRIDIASVFDARQNPKKLDEM